MLKIPRKFHWIWFGLLFCFALMHFYRLGEKPLHHDEGVNANFMVKMLNGDGYRYDPRNYHGPSLYYLQCIPTSITNLLKQGVRFFEASSTEGLTPTSMRTGTALAGVLVLIGILLSWPHIGLVGATFALILAGFSGTLLFYSRYFIHETYVLLFTLGIYLSVLYYEKSKRKVFFYTAILSISLLFCTKETSLVTFFILGFSVLLSELVHALLDRKGPISPIKFIKTRASSYFLNLKSHILLGLLTGVFVWAVLYSSFFTNTRGLWDSFRTYLYWTKEGIDSGHVKSFPYYIDQILLPYELTLVLLTFIGMLLSAYRNERRALYLTFWSLGMIGFYSLTPYKTPWLVINLILPMTLLSGYAFQELWDGSKNLHGKSVFWTRTLLLIFITAPFFYQLPKNMKLVYSEYDNDKHPQVYAHTSRSIFNLLDRIEKVASSPFGSKNISINIFTDKYWPLPYYLKDYGDVRYYGRFSPHVDVNTDIIIVDAADKNRVLPYLKRTYIEKYHSLRGGVPLVVFIDSKFDKAALQPVSLMASLTLTNPHLGLTREVFNGNQFAGRPDIKNNDTSFHFAWLYGDKKEFTSPFSIRWSGYILIPKTGPYTFTMESDDGSWLYIDGTEVVDNSGEHARTRNSRRVQISEGYHKIEIKYFDSVGEAILSVLWTPPDQTESLIPEDRFFN